MLVSSRARFSVGQKTTLAIGLSDVLGPLDARLASVFRKFYARMKAKNFSIASIVPCIPSVALTQVAPPHPPLTLTHSSLDAQTKPAPRLNRTGPRGGRKVIPGAQWRNIEGEKVLIHCSSCWEPDDHTIVWCRGCNRHFHAEHLEVTIGACMNS